MSGQTLARIVAVEVEEKGPDRFHAEARQLVKRLGELRVGLLAEHDRAIVVGTGTKDRRPASRGLHPGPGATGHGSLKTAYSSPRFGTSPVLRVR